MLDIISINDFLKKYGFLKISIVSSASFLNLSPSQLNILITSPLPSFLLVYHVDVSFVSCESNKQSIQCRCKQEMIFYQYRLSIWWFFAGIIYLQMYKLQIQIDTELYKRIGRKTTLILNQIISFKINRYQLKISYLIDHNSPFTNQKLSIKSNKFFKIDQRFDSSQIIFYMIILIFIYNIQITCKVLKKKISLYLSYPNIIGRE